MRDLSELVPAATDFPFDGPFKEEPPAVCETVSLLVPPPPPPEEEIVLSADQQFALETIMGCPDSSTCILTGMAGSGKTFVINQLKKLVPDMVVTAMTGNAAQLLRGRTLHSYAGLNWRNGSIIRKEEIDERVRECALLVIDEAPMASVQILQALWNRFMTCGHIPKVVLSGDWCQLPPVQGREGSPADSLLSVMHTWSAVPILKLTTQHRQSEDSEFLNVLNDVRVGQITPRVRDFLNRRTVEKLPEDCLYLDSRRDPVEERNRERLAKLPGALKEFYWTQRYPMIDGEQQQPDPEEAPVEFRARFQKRLTLKVDAQVMLLTNTTSWQNGSTGRVLSFNHGQIQVELHGGRQVSVERVEEEIINADGHVMCTVVQYPMMLAYALTIHKSMGQTIDWLGVNMNNHFTPGMSYVALSRVRKEEDIHLSGYLRDLLVDYRALTYV